MTSTAPSLLKMSPIRAVWAVSWPMAAVGLLKTSYFLVDSYWVGRLGDAALAAIGGAAFAWWMIFLLADIAGTGVHALVAQQAGAERTDQLAQTISPGIIVAGFVSVLLVSLWPLRAFYFELLGFRAGTDELTLGMAYLGASMLGGIPLTVHAVVGAVFRGLGDTRTALVITIGTLVFNMIADPILIWGLGPIPAFGISGAAWATVGANALGAIWGAVILHHRGVPLVSPQLHFAQMRRILAIGLPSSARGIAFSLVYVILGRFITSFGPEQMAGLGVGHRLESLAYMVCVGFSVGAATMVGQNIGAGRINAARHTARIAAAMCSAIMVPISLFLFFGANPLFTLFSDGQPTIDAGVLYLRIQTAVFVFMALEATYEGAFAGSGNTLPSLWIGAFGTAMRIPVAYLLAWTLGLGVSGIWIAIALTTIVKGVVMALAFERSLQRELDTPRTPTSERP